MLSQEDNPWHAVQCRPRQNPRPLEEALTESDVKGFWLTLMFLGAGLFGVIGRAWNGELMMIGPNIMTDLSPGAMIAAGVAGRWELLTWRIPAPSVPISAAATSGRMTGMKK